MAEIYGWGETRTSQAEVRGFGEGVIRLGGRTLPDPHRQERVDFSGAHYKNPRAGAGGRTCGCGLPARAAIPYTDRNDKPQFVTVCAICDAGVRFPRVREARYAPEPLDDPAL